MGPRRFPVGWLFVCVVAGALWPRADVTMAVPMPLSMNGSVALIVVLILLHAALVAAEAGLETLRPFHLRGHEGTHMEDVFEDRARYAAAVNLASRIVRLLIALLVLNIAGLTTKWDNESSLDEFIRDLAIYGLGVGLVTIILAELVPRAYAQLHPYATVKRFRGLISLCSLILGLPARAIVAVAGLFAGRFGGRASLATAEAAEEEIKTLVESAQVSGAIEVDEKELLDSVFEFTDKVAKEVMTPRVDLEAMPLRSSVSEVVKVIHESGHSRIPLYEGTDDQIVGIVHAKDLLLAISEGRQPVLRTLMRPVTFVPEGKNLTELIKEMRQQKAQMVIVQDEFGGTSGIVTVEDIVEELVGDIVDEYDRETQEVVEVATGWVVEGKTHLGDVNDETGFELDSEEFDTIGGYVFGLFGRQPKPGEFIAENGHVFHVLETDGRRIVKLRIEKRDYTGAAETPDA